MSLLRIGVLALQGSVEEHMKMLADCGAQAVEVRKPSDLNFLDGLIIPGGESTTISKLVSEYSLYKPILAGYKKGMAIYGVCAGAILLAKKIINDTKVKPLRLMDVTVSRNAYGRQVDSFEEELKIRGFKEKFNSVFIRAPVIIKVKSGVEVLAEFGKKPVMAVQGKLMITTFHPELTGDKRVHEFFLGLAGKGE